MRCTKCHQDKDAKTEFYTRSPSAGRGKEKQCKECRKAHERKTFRSTRYGITEAQYEEMLKNQHHVCAICHRTDNQALSVDHNHTTGNNRGLLCKNCNKGIGLFKENIQFLQNAIKYLEKYETQHITQTSHGSQNSSQDSEDAGTKSASSTAHC